MPKQQASLMTLKEWIEAEGVGTISGALNVTPAAVRHWRRGYVLPEPKHMKRILELSRGRVSFDKTVTSHYSKENRKNRWKKDI